ncbi:hypothetical protein GUJ93_ZPchr0001g32615 [Zizania palustris]|uniref:HMA domain-containing protein n=1 Tax=Zizania palustris TaxID=103762 RepID=A0A8J5VBQ9_ZIZPA|nr:hypothetical protein GUJ93_ZPchr0001g32615 [Zizania palustris]
MASGSEPIECQALVLRVPIHCEGCKKKVKKVLQNVHGVLRCDVDARSNKVTVTASRNVDANILVAKLRKSGKQAEPWPDEPKQQQPPSAESQNQQTKNQNDESSKASDPPAEKPGPDNAEGNAAEPRNPQPSTEPKKSTDETPKPAQETQETSNAKAAIDANADVNASDETKVAAGQQSSEPKGKAKQHQEERPISARVTMEYVGGSSYVNHNMPAPQPVQVMSYNVVRPTASAAYYATPPAPAPMPMARPAPSSQGYIDDEYTPSYYRRSTPYEPYYYPQPSPYQYQRYQQSSGDDYYYGAQQQRSSSSPPRDAYGEMFNDENANSCRVM